MAGANKEAKLDAAAGKRGSESEDRRSGGGVQRRKD